MAAGSPQSRPSLRAALVLVGLSTFVVGAIALDARATYGARASGDEPQYLLTAISLAEDFDLDISDELAADRFRPFHEVELNPQTMALNESGQRLSPHDPLLPLILAIPVWAGGWLTAKLALAGIAALTASATLWLAVVRFEVGVATGATVIGALFAAPPLVSYATQVYPEMAGALAVVIAIAALTTPKRSGRSDSIVVLAIVALPWLAIKYMPIAAVLAAALLGPLVAARRKRAVVVLLTVLAAAGLAYLFLHQRIYGGWTVYASGDHFGDGEFSVVGAEPNYLGRSRRLIGLLVDRRFGLIPWTPAYLAIVPAVAFLLRRRTTGWPVLFSITATGWAVATWVALTMHGWWWPGRQVVIVLPLMVIMLALLVDGRPMLRATVITGSILGTVSWLWLVIEASTDRRTLIVNFYDTTNPWYRSFAVAFPDHVRLAGIDVGLTLIWVLAAGFGAAAGWRLGAEIPAGASPTTAEHARMVSGLSRE